MTNLLNSWTLSFPNPVHESQYQDFLNNQRLFFLRALLFTLMISCFFAMLIYIIQSQSAYLISFMTVLFILHMVFLFFSYKLIQCLKHIMTILFAMYVIAGFAIAYIGFNVPLYNFGIATGIIFTSVLQYCDNRFKIVYVFVTNWVALVVFVKFELDQIQYIVFSISMFSLMGILTYLFEYNRRSQFLFSQQITYQKSILWEFSNDSLFAIVYNEKQRSFQLSFANKKFESQYKTNENDNNVKDFLRTHFIMNQNYSSNRNITNKQQNKQINLEEYLFDLIQSNVNGEDRFFMEIINEKDKFQIEILKFQFNQAIFFISIKENLAKLYQKKMSKKQNNQIKYFKQYFCNQESDQKDYTNKHQKFRMILMKKWTFLNNINAIYNIHQFTQKTI